MLGVREKMRSGKENWRTVTASIKKKERATGLVVQWLRLGLPMQGVWVRILGREPRFHTHLVAKKIKT